MALLKKMKKYIEISEYRFAIFAFVWGLLFSFLIIPWQTPDEYAHLSMITEGVKNYELDDYLLKEMELGCDRIRYNADEKIDMGEFYDSLTKKVAYAGIDYLPKGISINTIKHLPAFLGIYIGVILRLPVYWVLQMGELFSLLFYIVICAMAIRIVPIKKWVFEIVMLIPMCIQQASSISYDSVLLPLSFLYVAYILHLQLEKEEISIRDCCIVCFLMLLITLCKLPYIVMGGLIFSLPIDKIDIKLGKYNIKGEHIRKKKFFIIVIFILLLLISLWILRNNQYLQILKYSILQYGRTFYLFSQTIQNFGSDLSTGLIGNFGWLDTPMPAWFVHGLIAVILVMSFTVVKGENKTEVSVKNNKIKNKMIFILISLACIYVISLSMVEHTAMITLYGSVTAEATLEYDKILYQIPYIGGLQGRYYIPIILLFLVAFPDLFEMDKKKYNKCIVTVTLICIFCTCYRVCLRYW